MSETVHPAPDGWLKRFFLSLVILALLAGLLLVPWAVCWLTASGELDREQLFYLRSRGIGEEEARQILIDAYLTDVVARVDDPEIRDWLRGQI